MTFLTSAIGARESRKVRKSGYANSRSMARSVRELQIAVMPNKMARDIFPKAGLVRSPKPQSDLIDLSDGNNRNRS
jgi:hypothetical protein